MKKSSIMNICRRTVRINCFSGLHLVVAIRLSKATGTGMDAHGSLANPIRSLISTMLALTTSSERFDWCAGQSISWKETVQPVGLGTPSILMYILSFCFNN